MTHPPPASVIFFGAYDPAYPRNAVVRRGLEENGAVVRECRVSTRWRFWARYPLLVRDFLRGGRAARAREASARQRFFLVPEFCAKDVPLAKLLGLLTARRVVFDPLAARYETKILDWRRKPPSSLTAWWNFRIDAVSFRLADLILTDTAAHRNYFLRTYALKPKKAAVLPIGCDDRLFRPLPRSPRTADGRPFDVLFFGSFLPLHGVDVIAEAALLLAGERGIRFRFIGEGQTYPKVRSFFAQQGLRNVEFLGRLPLSRLPAEIAEADICLGVFGRTEKSRRVVPHKIYQALAMSKAVITARNPAVEEFFIHRRSIYLCDEPLPESLAMAILEIRRDPELRRNLAEEGLRVMRTGFTPAGIGARLLEILERGERGQVSTFNKIVRPFDFK
jgi:glycosyltransferase involved in cell wall biosynthesis